eukprot:Tamp_10817.p1 GENE.Tamp_10817~~Tamp_10817.p1  ORF type:complete len:225 (-),score=24.23 Tamp_10817:849-1523(-)
MEGAGERSSHITGAPGTGPSITAIVVSKRAFSAKPFHPLLQQLGTGSEHAFEGGGIDNEDHAVFCGGDRSRPHIPCKESKLAEEIAGQVGAQVACSIACCIRAQAVRALCRVLSRSNRGGALDEHAQRLHILSLFHNRLPCLEFLQLDRVSKASNLLLRELAEEMDLLQTLLYHAVALVVRGLDEELNGAALHSPQRAVLRLHPYPARASGGLMYTLSEPASTT